jgi:uncharacterized repeat protein (TIGR01451 family)
VVALVGGTTGRAATALGPSVTLFTALNTPTPGGNIAYSVNVTNQGTSMANHIGLSETIGAGGSVAYVAEDIDGTTSHGCTGGATATLTCALVQLAPGSVYHVLVVFRTPAAATQVTNNLLLSFDSQTNGQSNRKTVPQSVRTTLADAANGSIVSSYALPGDQLPSAGGQTSLVLMPNGFLNGRAFVDSTVQNGAASPRCSKCPAFKTTITIPDASSFNTTGPFWDGTGTGAPFKWTLTLDGSLIPSGFKLTGLYHDNVLVPACTYDTSVPPLPILGSTVTNCVASLVQVSSTKTITVTGWGIANGSYQFG